MKTCVFNGWKCNIEEKFYGNGRRGLLLVASEDQPEMDVIKGEPIAKPTVNVPSIELKENEIIIKDVDENEGMVDCLMEAGVIEETEKYVICGYYINQIYLYKG